MPKKFQNPPLAEAVCEFRFKSDNWDPTIAGVLFPVIADKFPKKESVQEGSVELFFDAKTKNEPQFTHSENEFPKFSNTAGNIFVIVKKNIVSIHCIKPYSSWAEFYKQINFILDKYQETAKPEKIERIGLRYVNRISLLKKDFKFSEYFKICPSPLQDIIKPEDVIAMQTGVVSIDNSSLVKTQLAWLPDKDENKEFLFDIDYFANNPDKINEWLEIAHNKIESVFLGALEKKTIKTFN